jgi:capsular polysaccharide transport system ATP-binding protein
MVLRNVSQSFKGRGGRVRVLDEINVAFAPRARVAILGQTGSGKTTLLRVMCGALTPDAGRVSGSRSISFPIGSSIRFHQATVRQHIRFVAGIYGRDIEAFSQFVANFASLRDVLDTPVQALGADMRGRLNFTLGFALPFEYYLFDGAMALGDPAFRERALKALEERREAAGFILATRFPRLAREHFRSGAVLHNGKLHLFENIERAIGYYESLPPVASLAAFREDEEDPDRRAVDD